MELPKINRSNNGMLNGIRSRFGFSRSKEDYDDSYDDDFADDYGDDGDYSEYSEYGPDYEEESFDDYDARYDYAPRSDYESPSRNSGVTPPRLVSIDDVREHIQVPDNLGRDPLPPRHVTPVQRATDPAASVPTSSAGTSVAYDGAHAASPAAASPHERSESLNSLFTPTTGGESADGSAAANTSQGVGAQTGGSFDPYEAYAGAGATKHNPTRSLTIIRPVSYGEVERVAKALKAGDAVVLALRTTPEDLVKRVLDFSFGVSSALEASVDCVADKVFVITRGPALTDAEKVNLRTAGVL